MTNPGKARIGTSNVHMPGNKSRFPPAFQLKSRLHYYSSIFNTVEVNQCFYKTPQLSTYEKWSEDVPPDFQFTLKLTKEITHVKDLRNDLGCIEPFLRSAAGTGIKKGCLLIQFPGKISIDHFSEVEKILEHLQSEDLTNQWRKAVEFRNKTWYIGETRELLAEYGAAMVLHDHPKAKIIETDSKVDFVYLRFHGPAGNYRDSYTHLFLEEKAERIRELISTGKDVYAYFNNTMGSAFENALLLKSVLKA